MSSAGSPAVEHPAGQVIRVGLREPRVDALVGAIACDEARGAPHFNQNEEFFVELGGEYSVPSLPIHHDVREPRADEGYVAALCEVVAQLSRLVPGMLRDLTYAFDPTDVLRPRFYSVYGIEDRSYLYLLCVDLGFRPREHTVVSRGTNDRTAAYRSRRLFVEPLFVPVDSVDDAGRSFTARQSFSQTWLGERGRGYFVQGIWIDQDLGKFFSRLFLPPGVRAYPFYPFVCRYRTLCETIIDLSPQARLRNVPYLHRALDTIGPELGRIERELRGESFSESLPLFRELKRSLPSGWESFHAGLRVTAYLNAAGMREFALEEEDG